ncbi:MAG TPA: hypothetical protein VNZ61_19920 [Roseomonas sp.]|nr:hypothetical protein [Roseomonas sp.]
MSGVVSMRLPGPGSGGTGRPVGPPVLWGARRTPPAPPDAPITPQLPRCFAGGEGRAARHCGIRPAGPTVAPRAATRMQ